MRVQTVLDMDDPTGPYKVEQEIISTPSKMCDIEWQHMIAGATPHLPKLPLSGIPFFVCGHTFEMPDEAGIWYEGMISSLSRSLS